MVRYDSHKVANLEKLKNNMTFLFDQLRLTNRYFLDYLEETGK